MPGSFAKRVTRCWRSDCRDGEWKAEVLLVISCVMAVLIEKKAPSPALTRCFKISWPVTRKTTKLMRKTAANISRKIFQKIVVLMLRYIGSDS
jgi:hypothetical protein